jgi:hypothetical protein
VKKTISVEHAMCPIIVNPTLVHLHVCVKNKVMDQFATAQMD